MFALGAFEFILPNGLLCTFFSDSDSLQLDDRVEFAFFSLSGSHFSKQLKPSLFFTAAISIEQHRRGKRLDFFPHVLSDQPT